MNINGKRFVEFGEFRLDPEAGNLWRNGVPVDAPPKAIETLVLLATNPGEIVSREKLLETVWKDTFVEEGNINYTISLLRKALGEQEFIQTVPRRGYRFVGVIEDVADDSPTRFDRPPRGVRWILVGAFVIGLSLITSFIFFGAKKAENKRSDEQTVSAEALHAYNRGKAILENRSVEDREQKAIDEFQRSVTIDPTFVLAHVGLAEGFASTAARATRERSHEYYAKAKVAAQKALTLDAGLAEALSINGWLKHQADWDFEGAETDLERSAELKPEIALTHYRLSRVLIALGKPDAALAEILKASDLDPVSDMMVSGRFVVLESRGEYDEALRLSERLWRENKDNSFAGRALATSLYHKGEYQRVAQLCDEALARNARLNNFALLSLLAAAADKLGQTDRSREALTKLEELALTDSKALYSLAMNYSEIGRVDDAIAALQKCFDQHEERMVWINVEPRFAGLRNDERFREIVARMGVK